jgi:hypothetical protein
MTEDQRKAAERALIEDWLQADQETKDIVLAVLRGDVASGILRGEVDIVASISPLPAAAEKKAVAHVKN